MTKQNKNHKGQATPEEMVQSGSQLILKHDGGTEQPIEEIAQDDPTTKEGSSSIMVGRKNLRGTRHGF